MLCVIGFVGSIIFATHSGLLWLDIVDHYITQYGLVLVGLLQCIIVGWVYTAKKLRTHISQSGDITFTPLWDFAVKFITPAVLIILIINNLSVEFSGPYEGYSILALVVIGRDWLILALFIALLISMRPWKNEIKQETK